MNNAGTNIFKLLVVLFTIVFHFGMAQNSEADSLWNVWNNPNKSDSARLAGLRSLAWNVYIMDRPDSSLYWAKIGFAYADEKGLKKQRVDFLGIQATAHHRLNNYVQAIALYEESIEINTQMNNERLLTTNYGNIASSYSATGNLNKAIYYLNKSLLRAEKNGYDDIQADCFNSLARVYKNMERYTEALALYHQYLEFSKKKKDKSRMGMALNNIGTVQLDLKQYDLAANSFKKSIAIKHELNDTGGLATTYNNLGICYIRLGAYDLALASLFNSMERIKKIRGKDLESLCLSNIGRTYRNKGDLQLALKYGKQGLKIARETNRDENVHDAAFLLYETYKVLGDYDNAYTMYNLFITKRDSLLSLKNQKALIKQEYQYEYKKQKWQDSLVFEKEKALTQLSNQVELNKEAKIRYFLYLSMFFIVALSIIVYRGYLRKQKLNEILVKKNERKTAMLKEIHHRVKNNLGVVNSLLRLQSREFEDERTIEMFKEVQNRVLSMALLHEKMYRSDDIQFIDIQEHIGLLVEDLIRNYAIDKEIKTDIKIGKADIGLKTLVPLGLIINEIITNALKHAFGKSKEGEIKVELNKLEDKNYELIIGDNGIGKNHSVTTIGLGEKLIGTFVRQLNGVREQLNESGTMYRILFESID